MYRGNELMHTIEHRDFAIAAVAVMPGGARFISLAQEDRTAKLWTLGAFSSAPSSWAAPRCMGIPSR